MGPVPTSGTHVTHIFIHIITPFPTIDSHHYSVPNRWFISPLKLTEPKLAPIDDRPLLPRKNPKTFRWWIKCSCILGEFDLIWGIFFKNFFFFCFVGSAQKEKRFCICPWFWIPFFIKTSVGLCCWLECELCYSTNFSFQMIIKI